LLWHERAKIVGANLSSYNQGLLCWPLSKKEERNFFKEQNWGRYSELLRLDNLRIILGLKNPESDENDLGRKGKIPGRVPGLDSTYIVEISDCGLKQGHQPILAKVLQ